MPYEVIIVDDTPCDSIKMIVDNFSRIFAVKNIKLRYIQNNKKRSSAAARNIGAFHAKGDVLIFLDDDVVLESKYLDEISKVYNQYPNAKGAQGFITWKESYIKRSSILNPSFRTNGLISKHFHDKLIGKIY